MDSGTGNTSAGRQQRWVDLAWLLAYSVFSSPQICILSCSLKYVVPFVFHFSTFERCGDREMFHCHEKNNAASLIINGVDTASEPETQGVTRDCAGKGMTFIQKATPHCTSRLVAAMWGWNSVARLWVFSRNARIWIIWNSWFLNVGSKKKKKKRKTPQNTQIKQSMSAGGVWQLGHHFATCDVAAEICICIWGDHGWAEDPPREKSVVSLERSEVQIVD